MATKVTALKRAVKAAREAMGPQVYGVNGKAFACTICDHDRFKTGPYIGLPLVMEHTLECANCSYIEFFASAPEIISPNRAGR